MKNVGVKSGKLIKKICFESLNAAKEFFENMLKITKEINLKINKEEKNINSYLRAIEENKTFFDLIKIPENIKLEKKQTLEMFLNKYRIILKDFCFELKDSLRRIARKFFLSG